MSNQRERQPQFELESGLPAAVDMEIMVLGAMLTDHEAAKTVFSILDVDDFSLDKHRIIFDACREVYDCGSYPDRVNVGRRLYEANKLDLVDGMSYLVTLDEGLPQVYHLDSYIGILRHRLLELAAEEKRECEACGATIYFVKHKSGKRRGCREFILMDLEEPELYGLKPIPGRSAA